MPGIASLQVGQYYAHPRNGFWPILEAVWGIPSTSSYSSRVRGAQHAGLAIWDVLARCKRRTSLDSHIDPDSIVANDFSGFFRTRPAIRAVAFNGAVAAKLYRRHVLPRLAAPWCDLPLLQLPSTSPANARLTLANKCRAWSALATAVNGYS